ISRNLHHFLGKLAPGARVLDLGCGSGRDAEAMIKAGFDVEATDGSPEIARLAEERLSRQVRVMRFDELDASEDYDAVWANASLIHVPRPALPHILDLIFKAPPTRLAVSKAATIKAAISTILRQLSSSISIAAPRPGKLRKSATMWRTD